MRPLASVVIPAHNPGRYIEPCIRSILRQTLPRDQFEVVFVDDGSTDGTGERLNRLAREQPHVRVIHIAASGAPGRPRNVGLEAALGVYVQFLDADDELAPGALRRLLRMARSNDSDIVLGKFASETMNRRQDLFTRTRPATTFAETPQLADASMGPTKLFRAALLRDHEIAFPEGWRQMEDQLFTMRAYLVARVISILGDEPCYYFNKREDEGHISGELVDPDSHAEHLEEVLDEVDAIADPSLRMRLMARFYRLEMLSRLTGEQFLEAPAEYRTRLIERLRAIARNRIDEMVVASLGAIAKVRSRLLLDGDLDELVVLARRAREFELAARLDGASWIDGRLVLDFQAELDRRGDASPLTVTEREGSHLLDPAVADDLVGPVNVSDELGSVRPQVSVVDRETALEWVLTGESTLVLRPVDDPGDAGQRRRVGQHGSPGAGAGNGTAARRGGPGSVHDAPRGDVRVPTLVGRVVLDPQRVGPGEQPLGSGTWHVQVRWAGFGIHTNGPLSFPGRPDGAAPPIGPALLGRPARWVVPRADDRGCLRIAIGDPDRAPAHLDAGARRVLRDGGSLAIALPVATAGPRAIAAGVVRFSGEGGVYDLPARFVSSIGQLLVKVGDVTADGGLPRGRYELTAHVGGPGAPGLRLGAGLVQEDGRVRVVGVARGFAADRFGSWLAWTARTAAQATRDGLVTGYRRLPPPARDLIRSTYGRLRA